MDLQKEREAFECEFKQTDYYIAHGDISTLMLCDDQYALDDVQVSFEMWQAAKAQAVPEGFVLVPREPTEEMLGAAWEAPPAGGPSGNRRVFYEKQAVVYKAMVEEAEKEITEAAQEPANADTNS